MRPIDADAFREWWLKNGANEYIYDTNSILDSIDSWPTLTIDAVPVVRCKDCEHCEKEYTEELSVVLHCGIKVDLTKKQTIETAVFPDDFCSYGERKEENYETD